MIHFLSTASAEEFQPFRDMAHEYLKGNKKPSRRLKKRAVEQIAYDHPKKLIPHVVNEFQDSKLGGGIASGLSTIVQESSHLLGLDLLKDAVFGAPKPKMQSQDSQFVAYLVDQTYKPIEDRKLNTIGYSRLPRFDSDMVSVWQNDETNELTVTIRGTKMKSKDLLADTQLFLGKTDLTLPALEQTLSKIEQEFPNQKYNVGAHSLGNAYLLSELDHKGNWDGVYLFSPPASPLQSDDTVTEYANQDNFQYFVNQGDIVSSGFAHFFDKDTLQNQVTYGDYRYDPVSSHSLTQFFPKEYGLSDDRPQSYDREDVPGDLPSDATLQQDTEESRAKDLS